MNTINIALITDNSYIIPTATTIWSIIKNKNVSTKLNIYIVTADIQSSLENVFLRFLSESVNVQIIHASADRFHGMHVAKAGAPCVASEAALLKFELPNLISDQDKLLYLDGDLIVRKDLSDLYSTDIEGVYAAVVVDSGSIYYKHKYVQLVDQYFNSGVMLLNLDKMRKDSCSQLLIEQKKKNKDSMLMDQNVFNVVFDRNIKTLPIIYNFLYVNLLRAAGKYDISQINDVYGTHFATLNEIRDQAVIVQFSSKDKPWKYEDVPLGDEWTYYYKDCQKKIESFHGLAASIVSRRGWINPKVTVIIPVYNTEDYLQEAIDSITNQTLKEIEIICINDGSTDSSLDILKHAAEKDRRIIILSQDNSGQSVARNQGIQMAKGKYIYFFDSDDILKPNALKSLYEKAEKDQLNLVLFDGESIFESPDLKQKFSNYITYYSRSKEYSGIWQGPSLYVEMVKHSDYKVSPCLQFFSTKYIVDRGIRFREGIIYEDNLFSLQALLLCENVGHLNQSLFIRRVRKNSTMTAKIQYRNFRGYYICLEAMAVFILQNNFPTETIKTAKRQIESLFRTTCNYYKALPPADRKQPWCSDANEQLFSMILYQAISSSVISNGNDEIDINKFSEIQHSSAYRLALAITFIPRKIRGGIRCYQEHGLRYTLRRLKEQIFGVFGR